MKLSWPNQTLADVYQDLCNRNILVHHLKKSQLNTLLKPTSHTSGEPSPAFIAIPVFLKKEDPRQIMMLFANHGPIWFSKGDFLSDYILDDPKFYFDITVNHDILEKDTLTFSKESTQNWSATFDYETIFDAFGLNGKEGLALFSGFVTLQTD